MQRHSFNSFNFLHTHFTSCHSPNAKNGFVKGEALRILRKNSSETTFEENNSNKKKRLDGGRLPTNFDRRPTIRNKIHKNESKLLKQNVQGGKRFIAICDTIPTLSVYYKGSLNNKNGILYKTNHYFNKFLKNHQSFPYKKGKSLKYMLVRAKKKG